MMSTVAYDEMGSDQSAVSSTDLPVYIKYLHNDSCSVPNIRSNQTQKDYFLLHKHIANIFQLLIGLKNN